MRWGFPIGILTGVVFAGLALLGWYKAETLEKELRSLRDEQSRWTVVASTSVPNTNRISGLRGDVAKPAPVAQMNDALVASSQLTYTEKEMGEQRAMLLKVVRENDHLLKQKLDLEASVKRLSRNLATVMAALDACKMEQKNATLQDAKPEENATEGRELSLEVVDVNRALSLITISGGENAGVLVGSEYKILRNNVLLCKVRVVEVRDSIAASVKIGNSLQWPEPGDRVLP